MRVSKESSIIEEDCLDNMSENSDNEELHSDSSEDISDLEDKKSKGNPAWADAMCRLLNTNVSKEKFILSKAKKDADVKVKEKQDFEIEIVDESGNILTDKKETEGREIKSYKERRLEIQENKKQKKAWENMGRVQPDITNKDKERELVRIATRGVVHLFNTVEKHQKSAKDPKEKKKKQTENLKAVKGSFMDILKSHTKRQISEDDPVMKKAKREETWSILKDDFMMGAEMKDWDKDSDNDK